MSASENRVKIWQHNAAMAEQFMRKAPDLAGHVVIVCDTADSMGRQLSEALAEKAGNTEEMREHAEKIGAKGTDFQTMIGVVPLAMMVAVFEIAHHAMAEALRNMRLPDDKIFAIVIAEEGATLLVTNTPKKRTATVGQA